MTKPKPSQYRTKKGKKTKKMKKQQDNFLKMLFEAGDVTPRNASYYAKCGYEYALKKYEDFFGELYPHEITIRMRNQRRINYKAKI